MKSLRIQLIFSHLLPIIIVFPLIAVILVFVIESQIALGDASDDLTAQAVRLADAMHAQPEIWQDTVTAQRYVDDVSDTMQVNVVLLRPSGDVIAASDEYGYTEIPAGRIIETDVITAIQAGEGTESGPYTVTQRATRTEIIIPVVNDQQQIVGALQVSDTLDSVSERFLQLRYAIAAVLVITLLGAVGIGMLLALRLSRRLANLSNALAEVTLDNQLEPLPVEGSKEIRSVLTAFNTLTERLQQSHDVRRKLLANLVHELGRPLGSLQSATQALINGADSDPQLRQDLLKGMDAQIDHLKPLLDNLSQLYSQTEGSVTLDRRAVDVSVWLSQLASTWGTAVVDAGLTWHTDIPNDLPLMQIDPDRMAQVVGNLVSNAIKYTPDGGLVDLTAGYTLYHLWIRLADTGTGMSDEELAHVFTPFFRGPQSARFPQGMGLGLAIAYDLTQAHNGEISVESTPGAGSTFTIRLPLANRPSTT